MRIIATPAIAAPKRRSRADCQRRQRAFLPSSPSSKILRICELPHIEAAKNMRIAVGKLNARRRGVQNARMGGGNRRRGRNWPDLVDRGDLQLSPRGRLRFGRDIAAR